MALMERVTPTVLLITAGLVLVGAACFAFVWWVQIIEKREADRAHSYEPLAPDEKFPDED